MERINNIGLAIVVGASIILGAEKLRFDTKKNTLNLGAHGNSLVFTRCGLNQNQFIMNGAPFEVVSEPEQEPSGDYVFVARFTDKHSVMEERADGSFKTVINPNDPLNNSIICPMNVNNAEIKEIK